MFNARGNLLQGKIRLLLTKADKGKVSIISTQEMYKMEMSPLLSDTNIYNLVANKNIIQHRQNESNELATELKDVDIKIYEEL